MDIWHGKKNSTCNMKKIKKVVVTGPESTGKTTLCKQLSAHFNTIYIPEYARTYVENINRAYNYYDIEHIARKQVELEKEFASKTNSYLFYDTYLIITKIWFIWCYKKFPEWLDKAIKESNVDLFLLLNTDIRWEDDGIRENSGFNRQKLFSLYQAELENLSQKYCVISGSGNVRFDNALKAINNI